MPLIKSAKKALRSSRRKEARNAAQKKALFNALRGADEKNINEVYAKIDKAAKKNIIHKNKAARLKSRLIKKIGKTPAGKTKHQDTITKQTSSKKTSNKSK